MDRAPHHHHLPELVQGIRITPLQGFDVAERRQRQERDFSGALARLLADELDRIGSRRGVGGAEGPFALGKRHRVGGRRSLGDHHVPAAEGREQPTNQQRPGARVSPRGGDTQHLETGILKRNRQRERVIDVIADVGVDDDGQRARSVGRGHIRERDTRRHECRRAQQARRLRRGTFHYLTARV